MKNSKEPIWPGNFSPTEPDKYYCWLFTISNYQQHYFEQNRWKIFLISTFMALIFMLKVLPFLKTCLFNLWLFLKRLVNVWPPAQMYGSSHSEKQNSSQVRIPYSCYKTSKWVSKFSLKIVLQYSEEQMKVIKDHSMKYNADFQEGISQA